MVEWENIRASIAEVLSIPVDELHGDTTLHACDNWDSLAMISVAVLVFEKTGSTVSDEEISGIVTLQDIFDLATRKIKQTV